MSRASRSLKGGLAALLIGAAALSAPAATLAADGEVLGQGSNIAGNVTISGGHARIGFTNLGDCPAGVSSCFVEVQFRWHCKEAWCLSWDSSTWYRVPAGQDSFTHPGCADGSNKWEVRSRIHFLAPSTQTIRFKGGYEATVSGNPLIGKYLFNVGLNSGFSGGVTITTKTASDAYAGEGVLGESSGYLAGPSSC